MTADQASRAVERGAPFAANLGPTHAYFTLVRPRLSEPQVASAQPIWCESHAVWP